MAVKTKEPTLSAYILAFNNEDIIGRCLKSLEGVDEIIVIDGGSTDRTVEICRRFPNTAVFVNKWPGFPKQRNYAFSKVKTDWTLAVDSDMEMTPQLLAEIKKTIRNPKYKAYNVAFFNLFLGTYPLIAGEWFPHWSPFLFDMSAKMHHDEKRIVHEGSPYRGEHGHLKNFVVHHNYPTVNSWAEKMLKYTDLDAEFLLKGKKLFGRYPVKVDPRKPLSVIKFLYWYPFIYFMWVFFWKKGYRSGIPGAVYSLYGTIYVFLTNVKVWDALAERRKTKPAAEESIRLARKLQHKYLR